MSKNPDFLDIRRRESVAIVPGLEPTAGCVPHAVVFLLDKSTEINDICYVHEGLKNYICNIERDALKMALDCYCTRVYIVEWTESIGSSFDIFCKVFPFQMRGAAFELAREKNVNVIIVNFREWLDYDDETFYYKIGCRENSNRDIVMKLREEYKKTRYLHGYFGKPRYRGVNLKMAIDMCLFR